MITSIVLSASLFQKHIKLNQTHFFEDLQPLEDVMWAADNINACCSPNTNSGQVQVKNSTS